MCRLIVQMENLTRIDSFTGNKVRKTVEQCRSPLGGTAMCRNTHQWTHREAKTAANGPSVRTAPSTCRDYRTLLFDSTSINFSLIKRFHRYAFRLRSNNYTVIAIYIPLYISKIPNINLRCKK